MSIAVYAFELSEINPPHPNPSWRITLHRALFSRALGHLLDGTAEVLDGTDGWLLRKKHSGVSVTVPLSVAQDEWTANAPADFPPPKGLDLHRRRAAR